MRTLAEEYAFNYLKKHLFEQEPNEKESKVKKGLKYYGSYVGGALAAQGGAAAAGLGATTMAGAIGTAVGGGAIGMGAYYLYRKHKKAKAAAAMEQDPAKKNEMNVKANQMKQDANKKKLLQQKEERLKKIQQQA